MLGRADIEGFAGQLVDGFLDFLQTGCEVCRGLLKGFGVDAHTVGLYVHQYGDKGHFDFVEEAFYSLCFQFLFKDVFQLQGNVSVFAGVTIDFFGCEIAHTFLVLPARAYQFVDVDGLIVQVDFGQVVHVMSQLGLKHVVGKHGVEQRALHFDSVIL